MTPAGFATRAVALLVDAAILNAVALALLGGLWLAGSVVGIDIDVRAVVAGLLAGAAWFLLLGVYLVTFWVLTGQTPGMRAMGVRVVDAHGGRLGFPRAIERLGAMVLAALPAGAGFLLILVDDRRRGLHDRLAGTLVLHTAGRRAAHAGTTVEEAPASLPRPGAVATIGRPHRPGAAGR
jgi:uncharacterized RDD family membrane protein YckC